MLIAAIIIFIILAIFRGPLWFLELLAGKAGPLGYIVVIVWAILLFMGIRA